MQAVNSSAKNRQFRPKEKDIGNPILPITSVRTYPLTGLHAQRALLF